MYYEKLLNSKHLWEGPRVIQVNSFTLDTKVKDQAHTHRAHSQAALISRSNTNDVFTSGRQRSPSEFLMIVLFEISNKLKLIHDFLMGPVEASRIADCFSPDEQTSTSWGKKEDMTQTNFLRFPPHALNTDFKKATSRLDIIACNLTEES